MTKTSEKQEVKEQGYDEVPYHGLAFDYNRPENLRTIGCLFGMTPPPLETARILELGCSDGANLLRFAETYPKSFTLGVDLSSVEIEQGKKRVAELKLKNLELKTMSLTDLDESYGKFDYIICHGVFSWVPDFVQEGTFDVTKKLLTKNGLTFISYNALPGWNEHRTVRDLMTYHASNFKNTQDRINQSRACVDFLNEAIKDQNTPYAGFMQEATDHIKKEEDHYIRHEYLADENKAFYLKDFVASAQTKGLQYVGDTDLNRMYTGNLPQKAMEALQNAGDVVRTEQYIDFLANTKFRCTVLCHDDVELSRSISEKTIENFYFYSHLRPTKPQDQINLEDNSTLTFIVNNKETSTIGANDPESKALMMAIAKNNNNPLLIDEIVAETQKLMPKANTETIKTHIHTHFPKMIFSKYLKILSDKPKSVYTISNKPKVSKLIRSQSKTLNEKGKILITNAANQMLSFDSYHREIFSALDGKHTIAQLNDIALKEIQAGRITTQENNKTVTDAKRLKELAAELVLRALEILRLTLCLIG
ncbi:methyltransferase regulatory domain-containing protein [Rickettsiaceae bacterium]|nr:methyltransferase regulatory domain-containing protein [Rickettsiaceae bacterium]